MIESSTVSRVPVPVPASWQLPGVRYHVGWLGQGCDCLSCALRRMAAPRAMRVDQGWHPGGLHLPGGHQRPLLLEVRCGCSRDELEAATEAIARSEAPLLLCGELTEEVMPWTQLDRLARDSRCRVWLALAARDEALAGRLRRAAILPAEQLRLASRLRAQDIPVGVWMAPLLPTINEDQIEDLLLAARTAGVLEAGFWMPAAGEIPRSRLESWLREHYPGRVRYLTDLLTGASLQARREALERRLRLGCRRLGIHCDRFVPLRTAAAGSAVQMALF